MSDQKEERTVTVQVTPHEEALRSEANRVDMWVSMGDPTKRHQRLLALYTKFFQIATRHKIEYWLEYGSSLGYCRHRGIHPWEWDMDIGLLPDQFQRLKEIGEQYERDDPHFGFKYYKDPDYETAAFCFYDKSDDNILCDIAEYRIEGELIVNCVPEWHYPAYKVSDILPPRRVMMLGEVALVQNRAEAVLSKTEDILGQCTGGENATEWTLNSVPWMQYDPVPFLLLHMFHPQRAALLCQPAVIDVPEAASVIDGINKFGSKGLPFVVRQLKAFDFNWKDVMARAREHNAKTWAYTKQMDQVFDIDVAKSLEDWSKGQMPNLSFTDSPVPGCLIPTGGVDPTLADVGITADSLMLVLSPEPMYTPFHQDPTALSDAPEGSGGGWMWLSEGHKVWHLLEYDISIQHLLDPEHQRLHDLPTHELLYINNHALWGKMWQANIRGGDFLYFPPAMTHRVTTYERSVGLGGYILMPQDRPRVEKVHELYRKYDINPVNGIWKGMVRKTHDGTHLPLDSLKRN